MTTVLERKHITSAGSIPPGTLLRSQGGHANRFGSDDYCSEGEMLLVIQTFIVKSKGAGPRSVSTPVLLTLWRGGLWYVSPLQTMLSIETT